jgi:hypothetical protein
VFGPGLLIALLIAAFLVHREGLLRPRPGPVVYREVGGQIRSQQSAVSTQQSEIRNPQFAIRNSQFVGPTPEVGWLLERREALGLSDSQVRQLEKLKQEWEKATAEDRAAVEQAAAEFQRYMDSRTSSGLRGGRVRPQDLTQQAEVVSALSGRLAAARQDFWERAMKVLTPAQRERVDKVRRSE